MFLNSGSTPHAGLVTKNTPTAGQLITGLLLASLFLPSAVQSSSIAQANAGTIAYVRGDTRDEIRLIEADGSDDRLLWKHELADPNQIHAIYSLAWSPDGSELAFSSTHEHGCSLYYSDVYAIGPDRTDYRRITQAPACAELADFPQGRVEIPVENCCAQPLEVSIYFQGAPAIQQVSLPPNNTGVVIFENVADLGEGVEQRAVLINKGSDWDWREIDDSTAVDVQAGATVETSSILLSLPFQNGWENYSPTWNPSGSQLGYIQTPYMPRRINANAAPLAEGEMLVTAGQLPGMLPFADHLRWAPVAARANQLLYVGEENLTRKIMLMSVGSDSAGEALVAFATEETVLDLAWLPDGSGFVYALMEPTPESQFVTKGNIYAYDFATSQIRSLTDFADNDYAGRLSVTSDGEQIVFERADLWSFLTGELVDPDLWIMNRDGSDQQLLVENGRAPAWSSKEVFPTPRPTPPDPTPPDPAPPGATNQYLPLMRREG